MITAPTSAMARPKPARQAVSRLKRPSQSSVGTARSGPTPSARSCSSYSWRRSSIGLPAERGDDRGDEHGLGDDHGRRGIEQAEAAHRTGVRQHEVDDQPHHDRRQSHQGVEQQDQDRPAAEAGDGDQGADRQADQRRRTGWPTGSPAATARRSRPELASKAAMSRNASAMAAAKSCMGCGPGAHSAAAFCAAPCQRSKSKIMQAGAMRRLAQCDAKVKT